MRTAIPLLVLLLLANAQWAAASPAEWLPTSGKPTAWVRSTADARQALSQLDPTNAQVAKHTPWLKERASLLLRVDSFDWKSQTAVDLVEAAALDLAAGKTPLQRYAGQGVGIGYWSEAMQQIEAVWVQVPPNYDPNRDYQVFMYYKCGGAIRYREGTVQGGYRPTAEMCRKFDDTFHVWSSLSTQLKGRSGAVVEFQEAMVALQRDFSINPDRTFATGYSDGGFTSLWLASHHPHLLAGVIPYCANWQYGNVAETGLFNVPVLIADGWSDGGYNSANFTRFHALRNMGYDISCLFGHHGHTYHAYEDEAEMTQIIDWARKQRRQQHPRRVRYATWNLAWHRAYWFSIERMMQPALTAQIDAEVKENNRVEVQSQNVAAFRLSLDTNLVDVTKPLIVVSNGKIVYEGPHSADFLIELEAASETRPAKIPEAHGGLLAKQRSVSYDLEAVRNMPTHPWLEVRPTNVSAAQQQLVEKWVPRHAVDDTKVTEADLAKFNLVLYGGPDINLVAARFAEEFPIEFGKHTFTLGHRVYDQPEHAIQFVYPNRLASGRHIIVHACNDLAVASQHNFNWQFGPGAGEFRTGDVALFGVKEEITPFGFTFHRPSAKFHVLNAAWQENIEVLGQASERFGYPEVLRLWADAMREVAHVDAAVVLRFPTHWNRWNTQLAKGPITVHELASTAMLPEYACLCEVSGELLKRMCLEAAATSVLSDSRDPAYRPGKSLALTDIKDKQVYRIALDNRGSTRFCYGVDRSKMPHLFAFSTPAEFLAMEGTQLPLKNLRFSNIEWTDAAIRYVRKHETISPRAECFDLSRYVLDPQLNDLGSYDWLHMQGRGATLHLAVQAEGEPQLSPPRANSKAFREVPVTDKSLKFDYSRLSRKLPVQLEMSTRTFAIDSAGEQESFTLVPEAEAQRQIGHVVLLQLQIANQGDQEAQGMVILGTPQTDRHLAATWPERNTTPPALHSFIGFQQTTPRPEASATRTAQLLVVKRETPTAELKLPNVGVIGIEQEFRLLPHKTTNASLLLLSLDSNAGKGQELGAFLKAIEASLFDVLKLPNDS